MWRSGGGFPVEVALEQRPVEGKVWLCRDQQNVAFRCGSCRAKALRKECAGSVHVGGEEEGGGVWGSGGRSRR